MKTAHAIGLVLLAFAAGALLTGVTANGGMAGWSPAEMWAFCQNMMQSGGMGQP